ncbi:MAG: hypothetical protein IJC30_04510 [Alphaproteobacteria bacterium]|nr:hypothetical protein [Alphaproteobacteria bacterium]
MSVIETLKKRSEKHKNGLVIEADWGWLGPKPAKTRAEKIRQIKTEYIDDRALLTIGATVSDFEEYTCISATVSVQELIQFVAELKGNEKFLIISDMDKASFEEQEKFVPLLKNRQIMSETLPNDVQMIIPASDEEQVSKNLRKYVFTIKV